MCQNIYRKIFYKNSECDNLPLSACPVCFEEIYRGYDAYLMEEHYYDKKSCCYHALFLLANEADFFDYCAVYSDEFQIYCEMQHNKDTSGDSMYKRFCMLDKTQFGYWYAMQNKTTIKLLRAGE